MTIEYITPPESRLEAYAKSTWPGKTNIFSSFKEYHISSMRECIENKWQLLEYTILCILVHDCGYPLKDVYEYLKVLPWALNNTIPKDLSFFELQYSWYNTILEDDAEPAGCGSPEVVLRYVDEGQIHRLKTQFEFWQAAGERVWEDHFDDMDSSKWFGPQGKAFEGRLGIPGFSGGELDDYGRLRLSANEAGEIQSGCEGSVGNSVQGVQDAAEDMHK